MRIFKTDPPAKSPLQTMQLLHLQLHHLIFPGAILGLGLLYGSCIPQGLCSANPGTAEQSQWDLYHSGKYVFSEQHYNFLILRTFSAHKLLLSETLLRHLYDLYNYFV